MNIVRSLVVTVVSAAVLAAPVVTPVLGGPRPVEPVIQTIAVDLAANSTSAPADGPDDEVLQSGEIEVDDFSLVGVTWPEESGVSPEELSIEVRVEGADGWGGWTPMPSLEEGPDADTEEGRRAVRTATAALWVGDSRAVQTRVRTQAATADEVAPALPDEVELTLVDPGESAAGTRVVSEPVATADAAAGMPKIVSRAQWGADESLKNCTSSTSSTLKAAVVHHTAGGNSYTSATQAQAQLRADYAYHTRTLGWCDLGYNFVVDKFGNIYEGRSGGVAEPVVGAHAGGFNRDTVGIAALGDYSKASAPAAMVRSIAAVAAWKLDGFGRDPLGKTTLTSAGGGTARYAAGTSVTLNVISGHRDVGYTECPGGNLYSQLASVRTQAAALVGSGSDAGAPTPAPAPAPAVAPGLARTSTDPRVYAVSGTAKHLVPDEPTLAALAPLGGVSVVSTASLSSLTTGPPMGRFVSGPDRAVWFLDGGGKSYVDSCDLVTLFGGSCAALPGLTAEQLTRFPTGRPLGRFVLDADRSVWFLHAGTRSYVDSCDLVELLGAACATLPALTTDQVTRFRPGHPLGRVLTAPDRSVWFLDAGTRMYVDSCDLVSAVGGSCAALPEVPTSVLERVPTGMPLGRFVTGPDRSVWLLDAGSRFYVSSCGLVEALGSACAGLPPLSEEALRRLPAATDLGRFVAAPDGAVWFVDAGTRRYVADCALVARFGSSCLRLPSLSTQALSLLAPAPALTPFVRGPAPDVFAAVAGERRAVTSWGDLQAAAGSSAPTVTQITGAALGELPQGVRLVAPGTLLRTAADPRVVMVDGLRGSVALESFSAATSLGVAPVVSVVAADVAAAYPAGPRYLTPTVACGTDRFLGVGGTWRRVAPTAAASYGITWSALDAVTCTAVGRSVASGTHSGPLLVKADGSATVYEVSGGVRRPVETWAALVRIAGTQSPTVVTYGATALAALPVGSPLR